MIDKKYFYDKAKELKLFNKFSQLQVQNIEALIDASDDAGLIKEQLAYVLATVYHETDKTMKPIEEYGKGKNRTYGHKVWYSGKRYNDVDIIYYGRGHTQNTWRDNYVKPGLFNTKK